MGCRATTHTDLQIRAHQKGIKVEVIHNASILNAVGACGLQLYRYGEVRGGTFSHNHVCCTPTFFMHLHKLLWWKHAGMIYAVCSTKSEAADITCAAGFN